MQQDTFEILEASNKSFSVCLFVFIKLHIYCGSTVGTLPLIHSGAQADGGAISSTLGPDQEPPEEKREAAESRPPLNHQGPRHPCLLSRGEDSASRGPGDAGKCGR